MNKMEKTNSTKFIFYYLIITKKRQITLINHKTYQNIPKLHKNPKSTAPDSAFP